MTRPANRAANAGGFLIAASVIVGTGVGLVKGESSVGFLIGLAVGVALSVGLWLLDRR